MAPDESPPQQAQPIAVIHANYMGAYGGPFDIALDFGNRIDPNETPQAAIRVFMSWEHLKVMIPVLQGLLENYEGQVGDVPNLVREEEPAQ